MRLSLFAAAILATAAAAPAFAQSSKPWPLNNPTHRAYFCANHGDESDQTMPPGYGAAINKVLGEAQRAGATAWDALRSIKSVAGCEDALAQRTAARPDKVATKSLVPEKK
ncbi:hypothetical protein [Ramlibacter sp. AN1133]|uniref:hypothetical protein n=1 Tax=Ramlibacter sp. AN1133 TaxID=3133429 RepID=UPI0030C596B4